MAKIEIDGFVDEVLEGRNGVYGIKVSEPHRRKNDRDEWETVARTFHRVTGAYESGIQFATFAKGDRVTVVGKQVTDPYTDGQGQKRYPLVVKASSVVRNDGPGRAQQQAPADSWGTTPVGGGWGDGTSPF